MVNKPREIFNIPIQPDTYVEIEPDDEWEIKAVNTFTRCKWTPFEGRRVRGRVRGVVLRGKEIFRDGQVLAKPGSGRNIRKSILITL
jgi:carbamoyl-phosphate synthase/aspartate carbamoyltransferase/dihydroorotase